MSKRFADVMRNVTESKSKPGVDHPGDYYSDNENYFDNFNLSENPHNQSQAEFGHADPIAKKTQNNSGVNPGKAHNESNNLFNEPNDVSKTMKRQPDGRNTQGNYEDEFDRNALEMLNSNEDYEQYEYDDYHDEQHDAGNQRHAHEQTGGLKSNSNVPVQNNNVVKKSINDVHGNQQQQPTRPKSNNQTMTATNQETFRNDNSFQNTPSNLNRFQKLDQTFENDSEESYIKNLKTCLKKIFNFYSSFANRLTNNQMKGSQFLKIATDSNIIDRDFDAKTVELLFISVNRNQKGINYEKFVRLLHTVAQNKYGLQDPNANFKHLLENNIMPLYNTIYNETDLGTEDKILRSKINFATLMLVHLRKEIFYAIYVHYFPDEKNSVNRVVNEKALGEKSKQSLLLFLREFELLPGLLNIGIVNNFYNELMAMDMFDSKISSVVDLRKILGSELGTQFTSMMFIFFLIKISIFIFSDPNNVPKKFRDIHFTSDEKFYMLLERLEISQGFYNLAYGKFSKSQNSRLTLVSKELADLHKETSAFPNFEDYIDESDSAPWMILNFDFELKPSKPKSYFVNKLSTTQTKVISETQVALTGNGKSMTSTARPSDSLKLEPDFQLAIEKYLEDLKKIFFHYATTKEGRSTDNQMNSFRFIKFLKDTKIVRNEITLEKFTMKAEGDTQTIMMKDADIIFRSLTHTNKRSTHLLRDKSSEKVKTSNVISIVGFLKAIELIAMKIFPTLTYKKAFENLYFNKILKHLSASNKDDQSPDDSVNERRRPTNEKIGLSNKYLKILCDILKDEKLIDLLQFVHKALIPVYSSYCLNSMLINFDEFFDMMKDFEIFPEIVPKVKLESIFESLCYVYLQNPDNPNKSKAVADVVDQHLFVESFILMAQDLKFNFKKAPNLYQKITYLMEIMNESGGFAKVTSRNPAFKKYDMVSKIKAKYPDYFLI
jgi:hypothetical protein